MLRKIKQLLTSIFNPVSEDDEAITPSDDDLKTYDEGAKYLEKTGDSYQNHDTYWREIFAEYRRQKKNYKIVFEFIPEKQNFKNVRSFLQYREGSYKPWKMIRDLCEEQAGGKCVICSKPTPDSKNATECHEQWGFDEKRKIEKLLNFEALCKTCHEIKHINRFFSHDEKKNEKFNLLMSRYCELNGISKEQGLKDFQFAVSERKRRNKFEFVLDLDLLNVYGYDIVELFNCHEPSFLTFIETKFKQNKDIDTE